jgi:hypothetical protein
MSVGMEGEMPGVAWLQGFQGSKLSYIHWKSERPTKGEESMWLLDLYTGSFEWRRA